MLPSDPDSAGNSADLRSIVESLAAIQRQLLHMILCWQEAGQVDTAMSHTATVALHVDVQKAEDAIRDLNRQLSLMLSVE